MRKMRKQPKGQLNPWSQRTWYHGDRVYCKVGTKPVIYDLYDGRGMDGLLVARPVKKNGKLRTAVEVDGVWYWTD